MATQPPPGKSPHRHLVLSDESSATEYTSSESEAVTRTRESLPAQIEKVVIDLGDSDDEVEAQTSRGTRSNEMGTRPEAERELAMAAEASEDEASTDKRPGLAEAFPPDWSCDVTCDMCANGPSLSFGAWYSWCCGKPSRSCDCRNEDQQQKKKALRYEHQAWSGKVHRLCALWSTEVYQNADEPWKVMELETAIRRSRKTKCSDCGRFGATVGCRVRSCKTTYHYPCGDRLSASMKVRMWEGYVKPVACKNHCRVKGKQRRRRRRGKLAQEAGNEVGSNGEKENLIFNSLVRTPFMAEGGGKANGGLPQPLGRNLLTPDFSYGCEKSVPVPCTNDVDDERPPYIEYITETRFWDHPLRLAKACKGCTRHDLDDPSAPVSVHVPFPRREDDDREDWLEGGMYGRLPYDKHGRLLIGAKFNELVECNERCECGELCSNRELQKGLTTPLELYKTDQKGWALRTLVAIARGKFVIECVGEMMTQEQSRRYGQDRSFNETKRSYMHELVYPGSKRKPDFVLDAFHASNVARFINHSCNPNMNLYRVYVETTYKWLPHIGLYAVRDIEAGEELVYDYGFERSGGGCEGATPATRVKCWCGAKDCRKWLLVSTEEQE